LQKTVAARRRWWDAGPMRMASRADSTPDVRRVTDLPPRPDTRAVREARPLDPANILELQRRVGNGAVSVALASAIAVQRDDAKTTPPGKAQPGTTQDVIFILRKPGDEYTKGMAAYVRTTLKGQVFKEVANIEEIAAYASALSAKGIKLSAVRIIGHGQRSVGGVGMTPGAEKKWRYLSPDQVKAYMAKPEGKAIRDAMAPGAQVEFWGCYVGGIQQAGDAWAGLFNSSIRSTRGEMHIATETFRTSNGVARKVADVPKTKKVQEKFTAWLLAQYAVLSASGEAKALKTNDEKIDYMRELFDRSGGVIRSRYVNETGATAKYRPNEKGEADLWESTTP
jgi:hypothetical protein